MKKKKKNNISNKKMFLFYTIFIFVFLLITQLIILTVESKQNEKVKQICIDVMIKYRSCEELYMAKKYCDRAEETYKHNNCSVTNNIIQDWLFKNES